jgi:hypothetical protein
MWRSGELKLKKEGLQLDHDKVASSLTSATARSRVMRQDVFDAAQRASDLRVHVAVAAFLAHSVTLNVACCVVAEPESGCK